MPSGSQAQAGKPRPEAWRPSRIGIDRSEYSFAELDHPDSKLARVKARGEVWRRRIESWTEDVQKYWPIPDRKVEAAISKEMGGLGVSYQIRFHRTIQKNGLGTKEDPVIVVD